MSKAIKIVLVAGALAGAIAAILHLYWDVARTTSLSVKLEVAEGHYAETMVANLAFANTGETSVSVSELVAFFSDNIDCTGPRIAEVIRGPVDNGQLLVIEAGKPANVSVRLAPHFEDERRVALCVDFEINFGRQTTRSKPISLHVFSIVRDDQLEFDGPNLDQDWHVIAEDRTIRSFWALSD